MKKQAPKKTERLSYAEAIEAIADGESVRTMGSKLRCHLRYDEPYYKSGAHIYVVDEKFHCESPVDKNKLFEICLEDYYRDFFPMR